MASKNATQKCILDTRNRPKLLKDFLHHNTFPSTSGFESIQQLVDQAVAPPPPPPLLQRSRSRSRAAVEATITSFHKLLNVVKSFHHYSSSSSPPPLTLPRSFPNKLLGRLFVKKNKSKGSKNNESNKVKVRDILRWKSFRDLEEHRSRNYNPYNYNDVVVVIDDVTIEKSSTISTALPISGSYGLESSGSMSSTWDELSCWSGNSGQQGNMWDYNNDNHVGVTLPTVGPKEESMAPNEEDKEQHSPVSVLDSPFREEISDEEFVSSFDKSLANMERTKKSLLKSIQWFESLVGVEQDDETELVGEVGEEQGAETSDEDDNVIEAKTKVSSSRAMRKLIKRGQCLKYREECIKEMEKTGEWSKFEDDQKEVGVELEVQVLCDLVNEVLKDLYG